MRSTSNRALSGRVATSFTFLALNLLGCQTNQKRPNPESLKPPHSSVSQATPTQRTLVDAVETPPSWQASHLVAKNVVFYLDGPQQARPADGMLPAKTRVRTLANHGSYSLIESSDGKQMYIATTSLEALVSGRGNE